MSIANKDEMVWEALKNPKAYQKWQAETSRKIRAAQTKQPSLRERVNAAVRKNQVA